MTLKNNTNSNLLSGRVIKLTTTEVYMSSRGQGINCFLQFFPSMIFCGEATKKTSIDGLKWRDLVMGRWWLVNFDVSAVRCPLSGVTKGFMC